MSLRSVEPCEVSNTLLVLQGFAVETVPHNGTTLRTTSFSTQRGTQGCQMYANLVRSPRPANFDQRDLCSKPRL